MGNFTTIPPCRPGSLFSKLILHLLFLLPQPVRLFPLLFLFLVFPAHTRSWIANTEAPYPSVSLTMPRAGLQPKVVKVNRKGQDLSKLLTLSPLFLSFLSPCPTRKLSLPFLSLQSLSAFPLLSSAFDIARMSKLLCTAPSDSQ